MMSPEVLITLIAIASGATPWAAASRALHLAGLPQRERAAAGADTQKRRGGGLRHETS